MGRWTMAMDEGELSNALKVAAGVLARGERPDTAANQWTALTARQDEVHAM